MNNTATQERFLENLSLNQKELLNSLRTACKKIAPVWPLENFVAVNPYLGLTTKTFESAAQELATAGGIQMTLPASFYLQKLNEGKILREDLQTALMKRNSAHSAEEFIKDLIERVDEVEETKPTPTVADAATQVTNKDWNRFVTTRISVWASSYFDNGQAIWSASHKSMSIFEAWKMEASVDRTPELSGLKSFRKLIKQIPNNPLEASQFALEKLGVYEDGVDAYLHRLLLSMGGWSAFAARLDWDNELYGHKDGRLIEFLAVLLCWEVCLLYSLENQMVNDEWNAAKKVYSNNTQEQALNAQLIQNLILQDAFDIAAQRVLIRKFEQHTAATTETELTKAQAIFCIDVRSEVYRRNLELVDNNIETLGFAGFFAFPIKYVPIGNEGGEANCPVLLKTGPTIHEHIANEKEHKDAVEKRILNRQVQQVWKTFKSGAVTCFSFVSPMGLSYLPKLFTDSFGLTRPVPHPDRAGMSKRNISNKDVNLSAEHSHDETTGIPLEQQVQMGKNALNAMSLSSDFAPFVMIVGHGSTMVNNPHATGYDCGACGGHTGEANARVAAAVLNNKEVRSGLRKENIIIPEDTTFLACLHDTTTDEMSIYNDHAVPSSMKRKLEDLKKSLAMAGQAARTERSARLSTTGTNVGKAIIERSKDWSQTRPEWGLAGCSTFVVAPRKRTKGINLEGSSFLHSYEWKQDEGFGILELIMTAPMVVTSWINLQYYGSTVDNKNFGSGNKTLHNVTAGVGVIEGFSGDLRVGLPMQSIHDGEKFQHEPLKLNVIIEAPIDAMNEILAKHQSVRDLCDNGWIHLLAMNENGKVSHRYNGNLTWESTNHMAA